MSKITAADAARLAAMGEEAHYSEEKNDDDDDDDGDFVVEVARTVQAADVERVGEAEDIEGEVMSVQARVVVAAADHTAGRAAEEAEVAEVAVVTGKEPTEGGTAEVREQPIREIPTAARVNGSVAHAKEPGMSEVMRRQQRSPRGTSIINIISSIILTIAIIIIIIMIIIIIITMAKIF
jgi:chitodextrinase